MQMSINPSWGHIGSLAREIFFGKTDHLLLGHSEPGALWAHRSCHSPALWREQSHPSTSGEPAATHLCDLVAPEESAVTSWGWDSPKNHRRDERHLLPSVLSEETLGEAITGVGELWAMFVCEVSQVSLLVQCLFESFSLAFQSTTLLQPSCHLCIPKHFPKRQPPKLQTSIYIKPGRWTIPWFTPNPPSFPHLPCTGVCGKAVWWSELCSPTHTQAVNKTMEERYLSKGNQSPHLSQSLSQVIFLQIVKGHLLLRFLLLSVSTLCSQPMLLLSLGAAALISLIPAPVSLCCSCLTIKNFIPLQHCNLKQNYVAQRSLGTVTWFMWCGPMGSRRTRSNFLVISVQYYWLLVEKYRTHCLEEKMRQG